MKKKILIMCNSNIETDPRPNRMAKWLKDIYDVTVLSRDAKNYLSAYKYLSEKSRKRGYANINRIYENKEKFVASFKEKGKILNKTYLLLVFIKNIIVKMMSSIRTNILLLLRQYETINWKRISIEPKLMLELRNFNFDFIISHDITLLPVAKKISVSHTKIFLDAREFYPSNFDDQRKWRRKEKPINEYLCSKYLQMCNKVFTVSEGLAKAYKNNFNIDCEIMMSLPDYYDLEPKFPESRKIRIIHHGNASKSRKIEIMIEMMDFLDDRFHLDLMLMERKDKYWRMLNEMADKRTNVSLIKTVHMKEIIPFLNQYDIGLFLCPPTNYNLKHTLPNKFFEFIQARLVVAIGPSIDMKRFIDKYGCGIVSTDFSPKSLAKELNKLDYDAIMNIKNKTDIAARELNSKINKKRIYEIIESYKIG